MSNEPTTAPAAPHPSASAVEAINSVLHSLDFSQPGQVGVNVHVGGAVVQLSHQLNPSLQQEAAVGTQLIEGMLSGGKINLASAMFGVLSLFGSPLAGAASGAGIHVSFPTQ